MIFLRLFKNPLFLIGFIVIAGLLTASFVHKYVYDNEIQQVMFLTDENGDLIDSAPIAPSKEFPLGSDSGGRDILTMLISGTKYTLLFAFTVAFLRVLFSIALGILYGSYLLRFKTYVERFVDAFHFIPLTLVAYYILQPILYQSTMGFGFTFKERIILEGLVLVVLAIPITSVLIANEIELVLKKEFILSAKTLGGSKFHVMWKHVRPHLFGRIAIIYGQQVIQVLLVLAHLGLLKLFLGGTIVDYTIMGDRPKTLSYEWSGMIGSSMRWFHSDADYIFYSPILFFAVSILAMNFMLEGFKRVTNDRTYLMKKQRKELKKLKRQQRKEKDVEITPDLFQPYKG
jgi:peptide/nickel transport system permease protein